MNINEGFIVIYFLVALNFLFNKLKDYSCHVQRIYNTNLFIRHGINIISTFFLLVIFTRSNPIDPRMIVLATFLIYIFFMVISRCHYMFLGLFIVMMSIIFYLEASKVYDVSKKKEQKEQIEKWYANIQFQLNILSFIIIFIGLIVYIGQHAIEYKDSWDWGKFWMGVKSCAGNGSYEDNIFTDFTRGIERIIQ